jgi:hypothetical protein
MNTMLGNLHLSGLIKKKYKTTKINLAGMQVKQPARGNVSRILNFVSAKIRNPRRFAMSKEALTLALEMIQNKMYAHAEMYLTEALAKQEQRSGSEHTGEPVAIVDANDYGYWADILPDRSVKVGQLLYTTPQPAQKPWVGLTDEDVYVIGFDLAIGGIQTMKAYKAIEAKLKEKNT